MHPGDVVGDRFEILRSAGWGGMGVVYQARDRQSDHHVALKVLVEREEKLSNRFAQEVELLSGLEHPHIVGYVAHGETREGVPFLVMPWLEGEDLADRLDRGPLSVDQTLTLAGCVADALAHLHTRGLVHRDLKPSNIFLPKGELDKLQVIDLGIARGTVPTRPLTLSGVLLGTPGYIAPEQARGDREVAPSVDVFALGCVLFECLTGKRLFDGSHVMAVLAKILLEEPPRVRELLPDVPDAVNLLVHRMVAKEPERRPRDGMELRRWLEDARRAPREAPPARGVTSLTASEQRVVTVLVVVLAPATPHTDPRLGLTQTEVGPFQAGSSGFGVRVYPLDERTAIALAPERLSASDQAAVLARYGRHVVETYPGASVALATGSAVTSARLPVGQAIDRGVSMVRRAPPGRGVHVDDVSAALITSRFDLRREGGDLLLRDERLSLDPTRPLLGRPTSCLGREPEFAILEATFNQCIDAGEAKVVLVTAVAGAGKSRLRHEFVRRIRSGAPARVPKVLQCRGDPLHLATPYTQIAQAVRQAVGLHDREPAERQRGQLAAYVDDIVPKSEVERVTHFLGELVGVPFDDEGHVWLRAARHSAEAMGDQIRLAFEDVVRAWCAEQPVVLVLEDLHWGDVATVKLLDGTLRKLERQPIFVLALARPDVHERFSALWKNRHLTEISLPPLPQRACEKLVHEVLGDGARPDDVRRIVERSEGNAFYLEELIRDAAERVGPSSSRPLRDVDLPETVIAVAQARLERLEPNVRKVLRAASVYGEVFSAEGVGALVGESPASLRPILDALVERETIAPSEQLRLAGLRELVFRHALLRGAAYATLTEADRALGHRLAAQWLEKVGEDREVVALHWLEGGERRRAAACFAQAGEAWWGRAQAEAAARCAVRSLLVGDPTTEGKDDLSARIRLVADALEASRRIDARDVMIGLDAFVRLPDETTGPNPTRTVVHHALERSLAILRSTDVASVTAALARAGCALGALSDFEGAKKLLAEATSLATNDDAILRSVEFAWARVAFWAGESADALVEKLSATLLPADPRERLEILLILATAVVSVDGREALARGLDYVSRAEALVKELGDDPLVEVHCCKARLLCFIFAGEHAQAADAAEAAVELSRRAGLRYEECSHLHNLGQQCLHLGEAARARTALERSNEIAGDLGDERRIRLPNEVLLAYLDGREARLGELAEGFGNEHDGWHELHARYWLGHLLAARAEPRAARELGRAVELARELKVRMMAEECAKALAGLDAGVNA